MACKVIYFCLVSLFIILHVGQVFCKKNIPNKKHLPEVKASGADITSIHRKSNFTAVLRRNERKMAKQTEIVSNVAQAKFAELYRQKDTDDLSCSENQYFDDSTGTCEDCTLLCEQYSKKMCQVRCPTIYNTFKYHLSSLQIRFQENEGEMSQIRGELEKQKIHTIVLFVLCSLLLIGLVVLIIRVFWLRPTQKPGKPPAYESSSFNSQKCPDSKRDENIPETPKSTGRQADNEASSLLNQKVEVINEQVNATENQPVRKHQIIASPCEDESQQTSVIGPKEVHQQDSDHTSPK